VMRLSMSVITFSLVTIILDLFMRLSRRFQQEKEEAIRLSRKAELEGIKKTAIAAKHAIGNMLVLVVTGASMVQEMTDRKELKAWAEKMKEQANKISKFLKRLATIKVQKDIDYCDGEKMLDIDRCEFG